MNCPIKAQENKEWLLDYAAGRLDGERAVLVEQHVKACQDCARFVEAQQVVWNALSQWKPQPVSDDFDRRLDRAIEAEPVSWMDRIFRPLQPLWRPVVPLVAACLLIVAGVVLDIPRVAVNPADSQAHVEKIEPDQVERTLDDIEMLRELVLKPEREANTSKPL